MNTKLKELIFKKLYNDLSKVEILPHEESIWFIDRQKKYWYFEYYAPNGHLFWRWDFFDLFFKLFSMNFDEYQPVMCEWVEEVLNCEVNATKDYGMLVTEKKVEEVLNCKVNRSDGLIYRGIIVVEQVLNCKVNTTSNHSARRTNGVEEVLNCKVNTTQSEQFPAVRWVEEVLNCNVKSNSSLSLFPESRMEVVLNEKII